MEVRKLQLELDMEQQSVSKLGKKVNQENGNKKYIYIITLNVNGLNSPKKRHRLAEWIQK